MENGKSAPVTNLTVVRGQADIKQIDGGGTVAGPDGVKLMRLLTIRMGLEAEIRGFRLTRKAPSCFNIIRDEFGIKVKRSHDGKVAAYRAFCEKHGFEPKTF